MNKKDLNKLKKEFKLDSRVLTIDELYNVYLKKDNKQVIHSELKYFDRIANEEQELYLNNFKKLLGGTLDKKLFELSFKNKEIEDKTDNTQNLLNDALMNSNNMQINFYADKIVHKILENYDYDTDITITFIKATYLKDNGCKELDDTVQAFQFILCSINKITPSNRTLKFNYDSKEFKTNSTLDVVINLKAPLRGFMFPSFNNEYSDFNKILYYTSKPKESNTLLLSDVLDCSSILTADEEKEHFNTILSIVGDNKITPEIMQDIYEKIYDYGSNFEEDTLAALNINTLEKILNNSGINDTTSLKFAFEQTLDTINFDFKINNILPNFKKKSIKIENPSANISLSPSDLCGLKQIVNEEGHKYLVIKLNEDVVINGVKISSSEEEEMKLSS